MEQVHALGLTRHDKRLQPTARMSSSESRKNERAAAEAQRYAASPDLIKSRADILLKFVNSPEGRLAKDFAMKNILVMVLLGCAVFGYAQAQVRPDTSAADSSFRLFLPQWERAQSRFINGDPALWKQHASHRADVTILGGFGGHGEKGWGAVGARYDWASSQYKDGGATMKVEYLSVVVSGALAFTVGIERQEGARVGDQENPARRALRATQIFRREDGAWKLLHRHADPLIEKQVPSATPKK